MLLSADWYIDQMKRSTYESKPLPVTLPSNKYNGEVNNQVYVVEKTKDPVDISTIIDWVNSENKGTKIQISANEFVDMIPSRTIRIPVDAQKVLASGTVRVEDASKIVPYIDIKLKGNFILKNQLIVLDILAHNNWERPIYFVTGFSDDSFGLEEYFQLEGLAYRLIPIKSEGKGWLDYGRIDSDILYDNIMNKFKWRGANESKVFVDYNHSRTITVVRARLNYARLAKALSDKDQKEKAIEVLDRCMSELPLSNVPYDPFVGNVIEAYLAAGAKDKAIPIVNELTTHYYGQLEYYLKQDPYIIASAEYEIQSAIQYTSKVADACVTYGEKELGDGITEKLQSYYAEYMGKIQSAGK
jgi:hypothetical protein